MTAPIGNDRLADVEALAAEGINGSLSWRENIGTAGLGPRGIETITKCNRALRSAHKVAAVVR